MLRAILISIAVWLSGQGAWAAGFQAQFESIDGGTLNLADWAGRPILVVNTASRCAFTDQYEALQTLYDTYRADGLIVLAVPSNDFRQELASGAEVQAFCELTYGIDMPMTDITSVTGRTAHPFYRDVKDVSGFAPTWNFNKVLIAPDGTIAGTWRSRTGPMSGDIRRAIEAALRP